MKSNAIARNTRTNNEGAAAKAISAEQALHRSVMTFMLWEDQFYESGVSIAQRILDLIPQVAPEKGANMAIAAREQMKLRHVPLLLVYGMTLYTTHRGLVAKTLARVIQRADELAEYCAIYFGNGGKTLSAQSKKGLAAAFNKFSPHELAKYNRDYQWELRDVLFLCHAKPNDVDGLTRRTKVERKAEVEHGAMRILTPREVVQLQVVANTLPTPDTWEVALSGGEDKAAAFRRLMRERKLGALAFLRNLRNMQEAGINRQEVADYAAGINGARVPPFRFIAAARAVPQWEPAIEPLMLRCMESRQKMHGKTVLLVDVSPSMNDRISSKSDLTRRDAALGVAILLAGICTDLHVVAFSSTTGSVPARKGFALGDAIRSAVPSNGTLLGRAVNAVSGKYERLIVLTDEESQDPVGDPDVGTMAYMVNLASGKNGVGYDKWTHIDGWSEAVIDYILALEESAAEVNRV